MELQVHVQLPAPHEASNIYTSNSNSHNHTADILLPGADPGGGVGGRTPPPPFIDRIYLYL